MATRGHVALPTWQELRPLAFYVGGFSIAGGFLGLVRPTGRVGVYAGCACAGAIVAIMIMLGDPSLSSSHDADWVIFPLLGALLGCAAAYGFLGQSS
jgi:hypothetical protein